MSFRKRQLPANFAQDILQNQIEFKLSDTPTPQVIHKLCVEYYESMKSHKYLYFKKKMEELFSKEIFTITDNKEDQVDSPIKQKMKSQNQAERIQAIKIRDQQKKMEKEVTDSITGGAKKQAMKIIKKTGENQIKLASQVKAALAHQDQALEQKLRERKRKSFAKSFSAYGFSEGGLTKSSLNDNENLGGTGAIEPLMVSFEGIIDLEEDQKMDEILLKKGSMLSKGRMASMRSFHQP